MTEEIKRISEEMRGLRLAAVCLVGAIALFPAACVAQSTQRGAVREFAAAVYRFQFCLYRDDDVLQSQRQYDAKGYEKDRDELRRTMTKEPTDLLPRLGEGRVGLFYLLKDFGAMREGQDYELLVTLERKPKLPTRKEGPGVVRVVLKPIGDRFRTLREPRLPKPIRQSGLTLIVVREQGQWTVDRIETELILADIVLDSAPDGLRHPLPPWWPGIPGAPRITDAEPHSVPNLRSEPDKPAGGN